MATVKKPTTSQRSGRKDGGQIAEKGAQTAREIVDLTTSVLEELYAGFDAVARTGTSLVSRTVDTVQSTAGRGSDSLKSAVKPRRNETTRTDTRASDQRHSELDEQAFVGQMFDLATHVAKVAADAASRLLEIGLGPVERLVDTNSHRHDDTWVLVGPVSDGHRASATFELENSAAHPTEITLSLTNPLASMKGTIPLDRVTFSPNPVKIAEHGSKAVTVTVGIPSSTPSGRYLGIVRSSQVADLTIILGVDVR